METRAPRTSTAPEPRSDTFTSFRLRPCAGAWERAVAGRRPAGCNLRRSGPRGAAQQPEQRPGDDATRREGRDPVPTAERAQVGGADEAGVKRPWDDPSKAPADSRISSRTIGPGITGPPDDRGVSAH